MARNMPYMRGDAQEGTGWGASARGCGTLRAVPKGEPRSVFAIRDHCAQSLRHGTCHTSSRAGYMSRPRRVVVVGGGNAAFCAAISAREQGADVVLLERAPYDLRGGNSRFTAGGMRFVYEGNEEIRALVPDLSDSELSRTDFGEYTWDQFYDDMCRITQYRADPDLAVKLVDESYDTLRWMAGQGVRFLPMHGRQSFKVGDTVRFWGGLTLEAWGGGPGLIDSLTSIAQGMGIDIRYGVRGEALVEDGVRVGSETVKADACAQCGDCLPRCPYHLPIPSLLRDTHHRLEAAPRRRLWG